MGSSAAQQYSELDSQHQRKSKPHNCTAKPHSSAAKPTLPDLKLPIQRQKQPALDDSEECKT